MSSENRPDHDWRVIESVVEYETSWYTGGYDRVELPDGTEKRYYWAELPAAVVIVAIVPDPPRLGLPGEERSITMVRQYRPTIREYCLELPAGIVEEDEQFPEAGARELEEEVGIIANSVSLLEAYWCATGVLRHRRGIVVASDFEKGNRKLDSSEYVEPLTIPVDDAVSTARSDAANDATLEGILLAAAEGLL